jgi:sterol 24-C-methyltransferase
MLMPTRAARTAVDADQVERTVTSYRDLFRPGDADGGSLRRRQYATLVRDYYNLVTDFYEYGWGPSFHFAVRHAGESLARSILRHEHYLALRMGLQPGMELLDVGCGVGGPMRNIARFAGVRVTGINNNDYQVSRCREQVSREGLEDHCVAVVADFMEMPLPDAQFDAAYTIEASCHAPDRAGLFAQIARVLKPGGTFAGYEWCLTDRYDPASPEHRQVKLDIEEGNGLPELTHFTAVDRALSAAGFEVLEARDLAPDCAPRTPWYLPLTGQDWSLRGLHLTRPGRLFTHNAVRAMEWLRLAPRGATEVSTLLNTAADGLVRGGKLAIFTPMYFFLARRAAVP